MTRRVLLLLCSLFLAACAQNLPQPASLEGQLYRCRLPVVKLTANEYDNPDEGSGRTYPDSADRGASLITELNSAAAAKSVGEPEKVLILSGGSLHGAFGAGFFYGWMNSRAPNDEPVPPYKMITGVSTGALQSTFIFLATSPDKAIKAGAAREAAQLREIEFLAKRMNTTTNGIAAPGTSYLANLAQDYMPDQEGDLLHVLPMQRRWPYKGGMVELVNHASLATMVPLRRVIAAELGDDTLAGVAAEATLRGRKLFVAIADLANGYGYAADLTRLVQLAIDPPKTPEDKFDVDLVFPGARTKTDRLIAARRCYTDALIASSSVPPGVPEVPIGIIRIKQDGHMADPNFHQDNPHPGIDSNRAAANHAFIDGGAAFAVFFSQMATQLSQTDRLDMDLLVNGSYYPQEWDKWVNGKGDNPNKWTIKLSALEVLKQSAELLQTQVRVFSVQDARRWTKDHGRFRWAFIDNRHITPGSNGIDIMKPWTGNFKDPPRRWKHKSLAGIERSCQEWHDEDERQHNPMEFFPKYMRCMVSYGMARGEDPSHRWNLVATPSE